jgi:hypothetical protein
MSSTGAHSLPPFIGLYYDTGLQGLNAVYWIKDFRGMHCDLGVDSTRPTERNFVFAPSPPFSAQILTATSAILVANMRDLAQIAMTEPRCWARVKLATLCAP